MNDELYHKIVEHPGTQKQICKALGIKEWQVIEAKAIERMLLKMRKNKWNR
jgi:hypothetical protein